MGGSLYPVGGAFPIRGGLCVCTGNPRSVGCRGVLTWLGQARVSLGRTRMDLGGLGRTRMDNAIVHHCRTVPPGRVVSGV